MSTTTRAPGTAIGAPLDRIDGPQKVTGNARYAYEHHVEYPLYLFPVQSDIARGRVARMDASAAEALAGVIIVITHENAPRLTDTSDKELAILQSEDIPFRGQYIGAVVAETFEVARHAAGLVRVVYDEQPPGAGDLNAALRRLMQSGFRTPDGERMQGIREMLENLRDLFLANAASDVHASHGPRS